MCCISTICNVGAHGPVQPWREDEKILADKLKAEGKTTETIAIELHRSIKSVDGYFKRQRARQRKNEAKAKQQQPDNNDNNKQQHQTQSQSHQQQQHHDNIQPMQQQSHQQHLQHQDIHYDNNSLGNWSNTHHHVNINEPLHHHHVTNAAFNAFNNHNDNDQLLPVVPPLPLATQ